MVRWVIAAFCLVIFGAIALPSGAVAQTVGKAVAVRQTAELRTASGTVRLTDGTAFAMGDIISTGAGGEAQLLFSDGTKIVVGAGSRLVIEDILMQSGGTAERFAVNAVSGTFRFITGKSEKPAYKIITPTATMGIRGTIFDFSVVPARGTNVVLFRGEVRLCAQRGNCADLRGRCTLAISDRQGRIGGPETLERKGEVLNAEFPYVINQDSLARQFQAPTERCNDAIKRKPKPKKPVKEREDNPPSKAPAPEKPNNEPPTR